MLNAKSPIDDLYKKYMENSFHVGSEAVAPGIVETYWLKDI